MTQPILSVISMQTLVTNANIAVSICVAMVLVIGTKNGELLIDFVLSNDLVIDGSLFQYLDIHQYSWTSSNGVTRNPIDHFLVSRKWCTSLMYVRSHRGTNVASGHNLMIAKFKVKLKKNVEQVLYPNPPFDSDKLLHSKVKRKIVIELSKRFKSLSVPKNPEDDKNTAVQETPQRSMAL
ncbi:hypothetical protein QYM36_003119 [Artemia franciscana]|uniref:Uncharacterized protein n=1 Tax=Artemia franciscana TaxID=6661 RepID=A0AA88LFR6_ARTSF|nr:hypothetical protein QYM36_003119 [Artemia franciscana]